MFSKAPWNPPSRFDPEVEWFELPDGQRLQVVEDASQSILSENKNPEMGFRWSLNPYRGCFHGCAYCYARPTHEYLGWGAGSDFERKILVKPRAAELLQDRFERRSWTGELVLFSGNTDCYQPLEQRYRLTRACLRVCRNYRNPVGIITRSALIERDIDLLVQLDAHVTFSLPIWDPVICRKLEPGAPPPRRRLEAMAALAEAGVPVGVSIAPAIPTVTERELPTILEACREAGASWAFFMPLWLPRGTAEVFQRRLEQALPLRAMSILERHRRRRGQLVETARERARPSQGQSWPAARRLFEIHHRRLGYQDPPERGPTRFRRPQAQLGLFVR